MTELEAGEATKLRSNAYGRVDVLISSESIPFLPHPPRIIPTISNDLARACIEGKFTSTSSNGHFSEEPHLDRRSAPNLALLFTLDVPMRQVRCSSAMCFGCLVHRTFFGRPQRISVIRVSVLNLHIILSSRHRPSVPIIFFFDLNILLFKHYTSWPNHSLL
jgi:hypothetical protein